MRAKTRLGAETSEVRAELIEVAAGIILEEGYAALTARRLADKVDLKRTTVHYYFGTIDDLLVAVIRREGDIVVEKLTRALAAGDVLSVIWDLGSHSGAQALEFRALALRKPAVRAEVKRYTDEIRVLLSEALARELRARGIRPQVAPVVTTMMMQGLSQILAYDRAIGSTIGHAELRAFIEAALKAYAATGSVPAVLTP